MSNKNGVAVYKYKDLPKCNVDGKYRKLDEKLYKYITGRVRRTQEYRDLIDYMKRGMDVNKCTFFSDYSIDNGYIIEMHHAPLCLYDIVYAVCGRRYNDDKDDPHVNTFHIINEVLELHWNFLVGLVPLNPTAHELVHAGTLKLHPRMILGNYSKFEREYSTWMSDEAKGKLEAFEMEAKSDPDKVPEIVKYKPTLIENEDFQSIGTVDIGKIKMEKAMSRFIADNNSR